MARPHVDNRCRYPCSLERVCALARILASCLAPAPVEVLCIVLNNCVHCLFVPCCDLQCGLVCDILLSLAYLLLTLRAHAQDCVQPRISVHSLHMFASLSCSGCFESEGQLTPSSICTLHCISSGFVFLGI